MLVRSCRASSQVAPPGPARRAFTVSRVLLDDTKNHYETLGVSHGASQGEIKKQFYTLSKSHHPDLRPDDPNAATKFMAISEAYHIIGDAARRSRYDQTVQPASQAGHGGYHQPQGSYHSSSSGGPAGSRPASGLSRRRTRFQGPPPSFFRNGGWGAQSAKRAEAASQGARKEDSAGSWSQQDGATSQGSWTQAEPGTGPGGFNAGMDNDVPHFNRAGHFRTQEGVERSRHRGRRWIPPERDGEAGGTGLQDPGAGVLSGFLAVMGVLGVVLGINAVITSATSSPRRVNPTERRKLPS